MPQDQQQLASTALQRATKAVLDEMKVQTVKHKATLGLFRRLNVFDPKQLDLMDLSWENRAPVFDFTEGLKAEWEACTTMDRARANAVEDPCSWWAQRLGPLACYVHALLSMPVSSAHVERTFRLVGVLDTKTRTSTRLHLRRTQMARYCNGDVEKRFTSL